MPSPRPDRPFLVHPSTMMMVLILLGITTLFGALSAAFLYSRVDKDMSAVSVPWLFLVNTFVLLSSSYWIEKCRAAFDAKLEIKTIRYGFLAAGASLVFVMMQGVAWYGLFTSHLLPGSSGGHGYLYAISILHFLHVIAGLPFLLRLILPLFFARQQGNAAILFIDDHLRRKLKHTAWYWHFIDIVWIYLMVFLWLNSII